MSKEHSLCFFNAYFILMCSHDIYQRSSWWEVYQLISSIYCPKRNHSESFEEDMACFEQFLNNNNNGKLG